MSLSRNALRLEMGVMDIARTFDETTKRTAEDLRTITYSQVILGLSSLTLPEIDAVVELVARMVPAGNVPGVILNGLARLSGRRLPPQTVKRDINLLFRGVEQALDKAMYGAFFAGPAAIIWGYQNLLKLAGKDPDDAFPEGTWQFYVDYALRDDTARHANETHGFDTALNRHHLRLSKVDRLTAWVVAAIHCLHQYPALLENEWRERVHTQLLREITAHAPGADRYARLYRDWEKLRPYSRGPDAAVTEDYPLYRRARFDRFMEQALRDLPHEVRRQWIERVREAESHALAGYQQQMSILAYLEPGAYGEVRTPIELSQARIGVIQHGHYYLIPVCQPGTDQPAEVGLVRAQIAALIKSPASPPAAQLIDLVCVKRQAQPNLRHRLNSKLEQDLDRLRAAPILINCDQRPRAAPLPEVRQAERGIGDHALTIFDTGETLVFDQSHIFFDGAWGAALAEIMTNEALAWAVYLNSTPAPARPAPRPDAPVFQLLPADLELIRQAPRVTAEACAESDAINVKAILTLRRLFKQRSDLLELTVNDLLVLYRAIHAASYRPDPVLVKTIEKLSEESAYREAAQAALDALEAAHQANPAILIPVDASQRSPRDRLYPMSFEVPLKELDLIGLHARTVEALETCTRPTGDRTAAYEEFDRLQRTYLATLAGFGAVFSKAKTIAITGESASVGTIKLLAHLPAALQRLLDQVPGRFDMLNDIIKGREVFSNVGVVAPTSTLVRFTTAKDDNEKKTLAWGVLTDAQGVMRLSLRDFRPHVEALVSIGRRDLANQMAQDYVDAYTRGLNNFMRDLQRIALASHETRMRSREPL